MAVAGTLRVKTGTAAFGMVAMNAPSGMPGPEIAWPTMRLLRTKRFGTKTVAEPATVVAPLTTIPAAPASTLTVVEPAVVVTPRM